MKHYLKVTAIVNFGNIFAAYKDGILAFSSSNDTSFWKKENSYGLTYSTNGITDKTLSELLKGRCFKTKTDR